VCAGTDESLPLLHYKQGETLRGLASNRTPDGQWQRVEVSCCAAACPHLSCWCSLIGS